MTLIKRSFYMLLGFSFPFYWAFHAAGFAEIFYKPIQLVTSTKSTLWPSFITATILYVGLVILIERMFRKRRNINPGWQNHHQPPLFDHESSLQGHCTETGRDQQHPPESLDDQAESVP